MNINDLNKYLYSYWNFDESTGIRTDAINNIPLFPTNGTVNSELGKSNLGCLFNSNSYLYTYHDNISNSPLISVWFFIKKQTNISFNNHKNINIINKGEYFIIFINSNSKLCVSTNNTTIETNYTISINVWNHVSLYISNTNIFISINNSVYNYQNTALSNNYSELIVGENLYGIIDELSIWNNPNITSLDEFSTISSDLYQSGRGLFFNKTKNLWEYKITINNVTSYPLIKDTNENRDDKLINVITYMYIENKMIIINNASNNKSTKSTIYSTSSNMGILSPGEISETKILRLHVPSAQEIKNIKLGLIDTGGITFSNNTFGVECRNYIDTLIIPIVFFSGLSDGTSTSIHNINVPNNNTKMSSYVYLNVRIPPNHKMSTGIIKLKWFFDFA